MAVERVAFVRRDQRVPGEHPLGDAPIVMTRIGVAARTEVFAIGAVQVALPGDVIDRHARVQVAIISGELEQVGRV